MNIKALVLTVAGLVVSTFYALESFLMFQSGGVTAPLFVKLAMFGVGVYVFGLYVTRIKGSPAADPPVDAP